MRPWPRGSRLPAGCSRRTVLLLLCAATALEPAPACRRETAGSSPSPTERPPQRQKVLAFWQTLGQATDARLRHDCAAASELYRQALQLDPGHEDALYYLGQCLRELGRPLEARAAFERLVAVNDGSARGHLALGSLLASPEAKEPLDLAAAERHLRRAHAINGEETGPVVRLGEVLLATGRASEAGAAFEAALRTNPKSVEAAFLAAFVAWDSGQPTRARRLSQRLREAAKVDSPVKGVLSEGDRRDAKRTVAPPLTSPLGRLLFGQPVQRLRERAANGQALDEVLLEDQWREVRALRRALRSRAG